MNNSTKHLCKECGQTDPTKFKKRTYSTCNKCYDKKYRRQKGSIERVIKEYHCYECGEKDTSKFRYRMKTICVKCKGKIYYQKNKEIIIKKTSSYKKNRLKTDMSFKIIKNLRD